MKVNEQKPVSEESVVKEESIVIDIEEEVWGENSNNFLTSFKAKEINKEDSKHHQSASAINNLKLDLPGLETCELEKIFATAVDKYK